MEPDQSKSRGADKFILRFDAPGLRERLKQQAADNRRSLNAELLSLIAKGMETHAVLRRSTNEAKQKGNGAAMK